MFAFQGALNEIERKLGNTLQIVEIKFERDQQDEDRDIDGKKTEGIFGRFQGLLMSTNSLTENRALKGEVSRLKSEVKLLSLQNEVLKEELEVKYKRCNECHGSGFLDSITDEEIRSAERELSYLESLRHSIQNETAGYAFGLPGDTMKQQVYRQSQSKISHEILMSEIDSTPDATTKDNPNLPQQTEEIIFWSSESCYKDSEAGSQSKNQSDGNLIAQGSNKSVSDKEIMFEICDKSVFKVDKVFDSGATAIVPEDGETGLANEKTKDSSNENRHVVEKHENRDSRTDEYHTSDPNTEIENEETFPSKDEGYVFQTDQETPYVEFVSNEQNKLQTSEVESLATQMGQLKLGSHGEDQKDTEKAEKCAACGKTVYVMEKVEAISNPSYHKSCFKCSVCNTRITVKNFVCHQGRMYCTNHYKQCFQIRLRD